MPQSNLSFVCRVYSINAFTHLTVMRQIILLYVLLIANGLTAHGFAMEDITAVTVIEQWVVN